MNLVGDHSVFFAASHGITDFNASRDFSFCAHAINETGIMVVEDAALDDRFHDNPLVKGGLIRFYAGVALRSPSGHALGALCVIDSQPHSEFPNSDRERLVQLARLVSDRLELRRMEVAATASAETFRNRSAISPNAVISCDARKTILSCNAVAEQLFGLRPEVLAGPSLHGLIDPHDHDRVADVMHAALSRPIGPAASHVVRMRMADGTWTSVMLHCTCWSEGQEPRLGVVIQNMAGDPNSAPRPDASAHLDTVTGLIKLERLFDALGPMLDSGQEIGFIAIGLAGLSDISNTLGHVASDMVLREVSRRLQIFVPGAGFLARTGGEEFGLVVATRDPIALASYGRDINLLLAEPSWVDGHEIRLGSCCGIATAPDHARNPDDLVGNAELALEQARTSGWGGVSLYVPQLRAQAVARRLALADLHRALAENQFEIDYQPQVRLSDQSLIGAEALLRWRHPLRGRLSPADFLPLLESSSLAADVGNWVLDRACSQVALWRRTRPDLGISINLFAGQFQSGNLPNIVAQTMARHGLPADAVEIEITENIVLDRQDGVLQQMLELRALGVRMSFDDFGTGFASLNLLRNFPISHLKIDKSFVQTARSSIKDQTIIISLIGMGHKLGLKVTAEGIENAKIAQWLLKQKCDQGQGYFFGKPCSPREFVDKYLNDAEERREGIVNRKIKCIGI